MSREQLANIYRQERIIRNSPDLRLRKQAWSARSRMGYPELLAGQQMLENSKQVFGGWLSLARKSNFDNRKLNLQAPA